jgi:hypothetical protein
VTDHDRLFKELLGHFLADFLVLFTPELAAELEPAGARIETLDKEFHGLLVQDKKGGGNSVDVVARLPTRRPLVPGESVVYVHVDAQATREAHFPDRMFRYYAHLVARHGPAVYPIALFSHRSQSAEPEEHAIRLPGLDVVRFRYRVVQLWHLSWRDFLARPNPAAAALMSRMGMEEAERPLVKAACWRMLSGLELEEDQLRVAADFVQSYLRLEGEDEKLFLREIGKEGARLMQYVTTWERKAKQAGRAEGLAEGLAKGRTEGAVEFAMGLLRAKLQRMPDGLEDRLRSLSVTALQELAVAQAGLQSEADLERWLSEHA